MMEIRTRRPVTVSLATANAEFNRWLEENGYARIVDRVGHEWQIECRLELLPHPINASGSWFRLLAQISCTISAESLLRAGILDKDNDARLIQMFGDEKMSMQLERVLHEGDSLEKARDAHRERLGKIREFLRQKDFSATFRNKVGQWVNQSRLMTYRLTEQGQNKINLEV